MSVSNSFFITSMAVQKQDIFTILLEKVFWYKILADDHWSFLILLANNLRFDALALKLPCSLQSSYFWESSKLQV